MSVPGCKPFRSIRGASLTGVTLTLTVPVSCPPAPSSSSGTLPGDTADRETWDVYVKPKTNGDEIEFSGKVELPSFESLYGGDYSGSDYIHVDNVARKIHLVNDNKDNIKPASTGFYEFYTVVSGALGHTQMYCTEPVAVATTITQSTATDQKDTGGTTNPS